MNSKYQPTYIAISFCVARIIQLTLSRIHRCLSRDHAHCNSSSFTPTLLTTYMYFVQECVEEADIASEQNARIPQFARTKVKR
jgi:hypothetical protein